MLGNQSQQFDIRMPIGSNSSWSLYMYQSDGVTPFLITGHTFEYVVMTGPFGQAGSVEVIRLRSDTPGSPVPSGGGLIALINTTVQTGISFALYPPATTPLNPSTYYHALWMDYADPVNALNLWWGQLMLDPTVQPLWLLRSSPLSTWRPPRRSSSVSRVTAQFST